MTCCICLFAAECLGPAATMLSRWDVESGGLIGVENRFFVWRDGIDAIPAIRFDCPLFQRGIALFSVVDDDAREVVVFASVAGKPFPPRWFPGLEFAMDTVEVTGEGQFGRFLGGSYPGSSINVSGGKGDVRYRRNV